VAIEVTEEAVEVLRRSLELGGLDPGAAGIRLRAARGLRGGAGVQVEFADAPAEGEALVETSGLRLFVDREVMRSMPDAVVAVEPPHGVVVVRPARP
jgi:Fe-S cluster assembly iron-binding protein IscA